MKRSSPKRTSHAFQICLAALIATIFAALFQSAAAQDKVVWSAQEQPIVDQLHTIRDVPDDKRPAVTRQLALEIRALPPTPNKLRLADGLASRATEGDFGHDTLQEVAGAARSIRVFIDYLQRHPEILIRGKKEEPRP